MAEITQRLGFEATQAIKTLGELNTALKGVNRSLNTFNTRASNTSTQAATANLQQLSAAANQASSSVAASSQSFRRTGQAGQEAATNITASWETMLRVVQTQVLVRALSNVIDLFGESADAAAEFQLEVGRISAIVDGPEGSVENLSKALRDLAVELGRPVTEVAGAAYEAFQNDLGSTAETMDLLRGAANDLALVTGGDLTQAINSISSILKSFDLEISEASDVVDLLFSGIDSGRISLAEFENSLGRITPLAREAGVSLEDTIAAAAAITQSGTDAAVSFTQLRNIFAKTIRPTETLAEAFNRLGVEGFGELVDRQGGLIGALQAISDAFDGDKEAIADAFNTIRAQLGTFNLLSNEGKIFVQILEDFEDRAGRAAKAARDIDNLDARAAQRAYAQLNDTILELGESTLVLRTQFFEGLNAVIAAAPDASAAIKDLENAVVALGLGFSTAVLAGVAPLVALPALLAPIALAVGAAFATDQVVKFFTEITSEANKLRQQRLDDETLVKDATEAALKSIRDQSKATIDERRADSARWRDEVSSHYDDVIAKASDYNSRILGAEKDALTAFADARQKTIKGIESAIEEIDNRIIDSTDRIADGVRALEDFNFDRSLRSLNEQQKAAQLLQRAEEAAAEAKKAAATAGLDERARANARELQDIAQRRAEEALAAADSLGNAGSIAQAEEQVRDVIQQGIKAEKSLRQDLQNFKEQDVQQQLRDIEKVFREQENAFKRIIELQEIINDPSKVAQPIDLENLEKAKQQFGEILNQSFDVDLFEQLGLQDAVNKTSGELVNALNKAEFRLGNIRDAVQAELNRGSFRALVEFQDTGTGQVDLDKVLQDAAGSSTDAAAAIANQEEALISLLGKQREVEAEARSLGRQYDVNAEALRRSIDADIFETFKNEARTAGTELEILGRSLDLERAQQFESIIRDISTGLDSASSQTRAELQAQIDQAKGILSSLIQEEALSSENARAALESIQAAQAALDARIAQEGKEAELLPQEAVDAANRRLQETQSLIDGIDTEVNVDPLRDSLDKSASAASKAKGSVDSVALSAGAAASRVGAMEISASNTATATDQIDGAMSRVTAQTNVAATAMSRLESSARAAAAAIAAVSGAGGGGAFAYHGARVNYRAGGGFSPRGADTQLTAVNPQEYIMNSRQSRNFLPELQAMNAGQRPQFREDGGQVTNIGDINVSVTTDSTRGVSGRDIAISLRRELRRGTSKI